MSDTAAQTDANKTAERDRQLQAMIDAAVIGNPSLAERLTLASVLVFWQLPDASLGWTEKGVAMSDAVRKLSVIMHLRLEALPGFKHILWMGNGFYPTTAYWVYRVNRDVVRVSAPVFRPLTDDEKSMYGITDGDLCCAVEQTMKIGEFEQTWSGTGILGKDDLAPTKNGYAKPGTASTKDRMKTLKTRAVNDMYSRNFSIEGMSVSAEDMQDVQSDDFTPPPLQIATPVPTIDPKFAEAAIERHNQDTRLKNAFVKVVNLGGTPGTILGLDVAFGPWVSSADAGSLHDAADVLEDWIEQIAEAGTIQTDTDPDPQPPKPGKAAAVPVHDGSKPSLPDESGVIRTPSGRKSRAAVGPDGKPRGRGRPPVIEKAPVLTVERSITTTVEYEKGEIITLPEGLTIAAPTEESPDLSWLDETAEDAAPDYFEDHAAEVQDDAFHEAETPAAIPQMEPEVYTGTEAQKEILRQAADAAGITDNASKFALAGAMKNRAMDQLQFAITGLLKAMPQKKAEPAPPAVTPINTKAIADARARLDNAIKGCISKGGAPMHILGVNPHNISAGGTIAAITEATAKLEAWAPPAAKPTPAPSISIPSESEDFPKTPDNGPGAAAYAMLRRAHGDAKLKVNVRNKIAELAKRKLRDGDHLHLPAAIRLAVTGNFKEIDGMIAAREARR